VFVFLLTKLKCSGTSTWPRLLWPPCAADADIIFLPCDFYLVLLFCSPNLSRRRLDVAILPHMVWP